MKAHPTPSLKNSFNQSPESLRATSFRVLPLEQLPSLLPTCVCWQQKVQDIVRKELQKRLGVQERVVRLCV